MTMIFVGNKKVGVVRDGVFIKVVHSRRHFMHLPVEMIAFDIESLNNAIKAGATKVKIMDLDTGKEYHTDMEYLKEHGKHLKDYGYGKQIGMNLDLWSKGNGRTI